MSFILDALRKSDQQRQRAAAPTLMNAQTLTAESRQPALLWYGLIAAGLVGAGILIGWMHQAPSEPVAIPLSASTAKPHENQVASFTSAPLPALPETAVSKPDPQTPQGKTTLPATATSPSSAATKPLSAVAPPLPAPATAALAPRDIAAAKPPEGGNTAAGDASREPGVMLLSELPLAIQQEIPKLSILAHSYSTRPKARFVFINDRMVHEEESPVPGLKLEQITPDGMVFSYKGYRFRRAANAD